MAGADGGWFRRLSRAPGAARARRDHQRELRGLRTGERGWDRTSSPGTRQEKAVFTWVSSQREPSDALTPWQLLKGMTLSLPGGIWCKFYISALCQHTRVWQQRGAPRASRASCKNKDVTTRLSFTGQGSNSSAKTRNYNRKAGKQSQGRLRDLREDLLRSSLGDNWGISGSVSSHRESKSPLEISLGKNSTRSHQEHRNATTEQ